jgi:negative regulator of flagellin synthesis FlgM
MADKINGYGRVGLDIGPAKSRPVARTGNGAEAAASRRAGQTGDAVEITDTAAKLKAIEAKLADVPEVDRARVENVRQRIESGSYQPDADRIARKLIRMEQELGA